MNELDTVGIEERFFTDREAMAEVLSIEITRRLVEAICAAGRASFIASGGTTPIRLYERLRSADVNWSKMDLTLSDERWVSPATDGSNEKLIRTHLLRNGASATRLCPLKTPDATAREAEASVNSTVGALPRPFDVTLLGMGIDGHTASLHPYADGLAEALDVNHPALVRSIRPQNLAKAGERMSLTLRAILGSRIVVILIQGRDKLAALRKAMASDDVMAMPVRAVLHQNMTPVQVFWAP
ncbi:MAG: 6-phosphogluconolactonase [Alphaproteobacteria bacterium]|nr:6-phosphogluconolactonase [Alphaproteobacteria bacterium]MDE1986319.1 6-phosphogluconolactonase [Alphaproteobacteria bacterium]MDE2163041.1 6-phosphogluconolactonase [Alphaproteobacteria bacterium]MDE2265556.1 6-phosphogluconolactonase [Alphaproteobacteria bacterium]MDE2499936.1 6-phosphogluconolactonase [Alphaproteobacteria bacterium]